MKPYLPLFAGAALLAAVAPVLFVAAVTCKVREIRTYHQRRTQ